MSHLCCQVWGAGGAGGGLGGLEVPGGQTARVCCVPLRFGVPLLSFRAPRSTNAGEEPTGSRWFTCGNESEGDARLNSQPTSNEGT